MNKQHPDWRQLEPGPFSCFALDSLFWLLAELIAPLPAITLRPHPHRTRREEQSKLGCENPIKSNSVHTAYTKQHVMQEATEWDLAPFFGVTRRVASSVDGA